MNRTAALCIAGLAAIFMLCSCSKKAEPPGRADFMGELLAGKNDFENAKAAEAIGHWSRAAAMQPASPEAQLDLANAYLLAGKTAETLVHAGEALKLSPNSAAALYVIGCAHLRDARFTEAIQALEQSRTIDPAVPAVSFQLGQAHIGAGQPEAAVTAFRAAIELEPAHAAAHYALSQALMRTKDTAAAQAELALHQKITASRKGIVNDPTFFEKCAHTRAVLPPAPPEIPAHPGVAVKFVDATAEVFGGDAAKWRGPLAVFDPKRGGHPGLLAADAERRLQFLEFHGGKFAAAGEPLLGVRGDILIGDINNDRREDVVIVSPAGSKAFQQGEDGRLTDVTGESKLGALKASHAVLADYDVTGKLGLIAATDAGAVFYRNQGTGVFEDVTAQLKLPKLAGKPRGFVVDDWNGDDLPDIFIANESQPPDILLNRRGGEFRHATPDAPRLSPVPVPATQSSAPWPAGGVIAVGDLNCDLRNDFIVLTAAGFEIVWGGMTERTRIPAAELKATDLRLVDYDNDGWLDLLVCGGPLRIWRNLGPGKFTETTVALGIGSLLADHLAAADFDGDGDTDLAVDGGPGAGWHYLRNDGGNANRQMTFHLTTTRSNGSGLGARLEFIAGGWRASRTVHSLPFTAGAGQHGKIDSLSIHWADLVTNPGVLSTDPKQQPIKLIEPEFPTGSCPYLYVWDGARFRFVTDLLGASPAGLRLTDSRFIDADTEELIGIGDEKNFVPRDGRYVIQITDELRELLFFDQVELIAVDHAPGIEAHTTSKLRPGKPWAPHQLVALRKSIALLAATRSDGLDATALLASIDARRVSPVALRPPQLRGLAKPYSVTLDFGPLPVERPLVLALTGWLRFGGGMANVAASHDPALPFPFPALEVETASGKWQPVDVVCGAPAGKTKSIVIDLTEKLPPGAHRLRLTQAFEIHWDRIALLEKAPAEQLRITRLSAASADLHHRGSSEYEDRPWHEPVTPDYARLRSSAPWQITPSGWCTRFGDVRELITRLDDAMVIMNCGDEMTLAFDAAALPEKPPGAVREFFLFSSGWDKDADFHVEAGDTVEPIPWHGMDDQRYGREPRPPMANDAWMAKYNTRWIGPLTLGRRAR